MRVHIADNHEILIEGLKAVLKANDIEVEGYSTDGAKVIMWREQHEADILILDVSMPIMNGYDVLKHFKVDFKGINVLDDEDIRQGIKDYSDWPTIPQLYINEEFIGGCDIVKELFDSGELKKVLEKKKII